MGPTELGSISQARNRVEHIHNEDATLLSTQSTHRARHSCGNLDLLASQICVQISQVRVHRYRSNGLSIGVYASFLLANTPVPFVICNMNTIDILYNETLNYVKSPYTICTPLQWRHNGHNGVSNHRHNDCLLNRLFKQIKYNIKVPRHWPLCGEFTGDRWIRRIKGR